MTWAGSGIFVWSGWRHKALDGAGDEGCDSHQVEVWRGRTGLWIARGVGAFRRKRVGGSKMFIYITSRGFCTIHREPRGCGCRGRKGLVLSL